MSAQSEAINATFVANILTMRATVYTRAAGGTFTNAAQSGLACYLEAVDARPAATGGDRRDLAARGVFRYDATYTLPTEAARVVVDAYPGVYWTVEPATAWSDYLPGIGVVGKTVDVVRAS